MNKSSLLANMGMHGGTLAKLDFKSNKFEKIIDDCIAKMAFDRSGKLWCLSYGLLEGLLSVENDVPVVQCGIDSLARTGTGVTTYRKSVNWDSDNCYFLTMTVCEDDSILLGTLSQGIYKYKNNRVSKITSGWSSSSELVSVLQLENGKIAFTAIEEGLGVVK